MKNIIEKKEQIVTNNQHYEWIDNSICLLVTINSQGKVTYANSAFVLLTGIKKSDLIGLSFFSFIIDEDKQSIYRTLELLLNPPYKKNIECRLISDIGTRWIYWQFVNNNKSTDKNFDLYCQGFDITEYHLREELLKRSEKRIQALLGSNPAVVYTILLTIPPIIQYISPRIEDLLGYPQEHWLSNFQFWDSLIHPNDVKQKKEHLIETINSEKLYSDEYRMKSNNNEWIWLHDEAMIIHGNIKDPIILQGYLLDITQRKSAEDALTRSEIRNMAIINAIPDKMFVVDNNGNINKLRLEANVQFQQDQFNSVIDIFPKDIREKALEFIHQSLKTDGPQIFEYKINTSEGWKNFEARFIKSSIDEVLVLLRDISERIKLEQMKTEFVHRAAHELRTPLTTAILMSDLIKEGGTKEEIDGFMEILHGELSRQKALVEELLVMGRIESDNLNIQLTPVDIQDVLREVIRTVKPLAEKKQIILSVTYKEEIYLINGDKQGLNQVFTNLLDNAIKYTKENGKIVLDVQSEDNYLSVTIRDNGIGIPSQDIPNIFTRFYRASNAEEIEAPGSGVGLFITKSIIDKHDGRIEARSELNKGSTFTVFLPSIKKY